MRFTIHKGKNLNKQASTLEKPLHKTRIRFVVAVASLVGVVFLLPIFSLAQNLMGPTPTPSPYPFPPSPRIIIPAPSPPPGLTSPLIPNPNATPNWFTTPYPSGNERWAKQKQEINGKKLFSPTPSPSGGIKVSTEPIGGSPTPAINPLPNANPVLNGSLSPVPNVSPLPNGSPIPNISSPSTPSAYPYPTINPAQLSAPIPQPTILSTDKPFPSPQEFIPEPLTGALPSPAPPLQSPYHDLPDVLKQQPFIPPDLISPIPSIHTFTDETTIRASKQTLDMVARAMQSTEPAPNAPNMTIDDAIKFAVQNNPTILNAIQQIRLNWGQVLQVLSTGVPRLTVTSAYDVEERTLIPLPSVGALSTTGLSAPGTTPSLSNIAGSSLSRQNQLWDVQIQVSQLLFDGGATLYGVIAAQRIQDQAYFQLRQTIDEVIANVKINFYQIILNRALIIAQQESVALLQSQLQDQINRYEAGTVPRFNVLQAEVALANQIPPLIQARNNLRISQYQLVQLLGMNYPAGDASQIPFNAVGTLDFNLRNIKSEESIRVALERSPQLKAQRQFMLAQAANVNVALSGFYPQVNANGGYLIENNTLSRRLTDTVTGWFFGVNGSWNVFDGFLTIGKVVQTKAQLMQAKINYDNAVRSVILSVQEAISNLQEARETYESQVANVAQALEALRLSQERLDAGAGTQLDVLNAQVSLLQAQTTELQACFNYISATAQYDQALSLNTQYKEWFDDPLSRKDRKTFDKLNSPTTPPPKLPRQFRNSDTWAQALGSPTPPPKLKKGTNVEVVRELLPTSAKPSSTPRPKSNSKPDLKPQIKPIQKPPSKQKKEQRNK